MSAPEQNSARPLILGLALGGFALGCTEFASMSLVPFFSASLGVNAAQAADAISAYALGVLIGAPILSILSVRYPRRSILIALMVAFALFNLFSALAPNFDLMVLSRFLCGLPHGAYFGVAALAAAAEVPSKQRSKAISRVMLGLTIATIGGVPAANLMGQTIGWRWCYFVVTLLALGTAYAVWRNAPHDKPDPDAKPTRELTALKNPQVLLSLATCAIGFGGFFAVYTYIASAVQNDMHASVILAPFALAAIGAGMTLGALLVGSISTRHQTPAIFGFLTLSLVALLLYHASASHIATYLIDLLVIGISGGVTVLLQTRLLDVSGKAQRLASALNQSAFNLANALGPWLAAIFIYRGYGFLSAGYVGAALSLGGIIMFALTSMHYRKNAVHYQG